jgi:hypothetical protein
MMFKKITFGLGGVVPLLQYIQGRKYEQLAELCGEVDETGVVPLRLLRNKQVMSAIGAVVGLIKVRQMVTFSSLGRLQCVNRHISRERCTDILSEGERRRCRFDRGLR